VHERLHETELLAIALGELANRPVEYSAEAFAEPVAHRCLHAAKPGERVELLPAGEAVCKAEVSRQIADAPPCFDRSAAHVEPEQRGAPVGRVDEAEQETDARRLPGPVWAEVAEDLSRVDA